MSKKPDFRATGLRTTKPRLAVLAFLQRHHRPVSAQAVFAGVQSMGVDRSSVFRTLNLLADRNMAVVTESAQHERLYELTPEHHHHHLHCESCGKVEPVPCFVSPAIIRSARRRSRFQFIRHTSDLYGLCVRCAKHN